MTIYIDNGNKSLKNMKIVIPKKKNFYMIRKFYRKFINYKILLFLSFK